METLWHGGANGGSGCRRRNRHRRGVAARRIAATWYSSSSFSIDVNLTDGNAHLVAIYCVDWDGGGRMERIDVVDAQTGRVLDTRDISSFWDTPEYIVWNLKGHVVIKTTQLAGPNAVISGIFFR